MLKLSLSFSRSLSFTSIRQELAKHELPFFVPPTDAALQNKKRYDVHKFPFYAGYKDHTIPLLKEGPIDDLPHVVTADTSLDFSPEEWGKFCLSYLEGTLGKYGAVLFRDLPLQRGKKFAEFFNSLGYKQMSYEGGATNRLLDDDIDGFYQASSEPPSCLIELHNEQAYFKSPPDMVILYAKRPADPGCGGESILCNNRKLLKALNPDVVEKLERKKIRYIRNCPDKGNAVYKPWQETFYTDRKQEVEQMLKAKDCYWVWQEDDWLQFWSIGNALRENPKTGEKMWFNQANIATCEFFRFHPEAEKWSHLKDSQCPTHATYGDGEEFEKEMIQHIRQVSFDVGVGLKLQQDDFLVMDNYLVQHGRLPYTGKRQLTAALIVD